MNMQWFKFYGQEYLSDPKMLALSASERSCWLTLLCYCSSSEYGIVKFVSEEQLMVQSGVNPASPEWGLTSGVLKKLERLKMIVMHPDNSIEISNWRKRQDAFLSGAERTKKWREQKQACDTDVTRHDSKNPSNKGNSDKSVTRRDTAVTKPVTNVTLDIDIDKDIEKNKEKENINNIYKAKKRKRKNSGDALASGLPTEVDVKGDSFSAKKKKSMELELEPDEVAAMKKKAKKTKAVKSPIKSFTGKTISIHQNDPKQATTVKPSGKKAYPSQSLQPVFQDYEVEVEKKPVSKSRVMPEHIKEFKAVEQVWKEVGVRMEKVLAKNSRFDLNVPAVQRCKTNFNEGDIDWLLSDVRVALEEMKSGAEYFPTFFSMLEYEKKHERIKLYFEKKDKR